MFNTIPEVKMNHFSKHIFMENSYHARIKQKTTESNLKKNFMAPFYGWGSTASRLEPL